LSEACAIDIAHKDVMPSTKGVL